MLHPMTDKMTVCWIVYVFLLVVACSGKTNEPMKKLKGNNADFLVKIFTTLTDKVSRLEADFHQQKKAQEEMKMKLQQYQKQLNAEHSPIVAFHVAISHRKSNPPSVIRFDKVLQNYGNCWNPVSHMFVAPVSGLYSFTMTIKNYSNNHAWASIYLDKRVLQRAYATGDAHGNEGTASAIVKVNKGQHVYGYLDQGHMYSDGYQWSHFVGFLLQKM